MEKSVRINEIFFPHIQEECVKAAHNTGQWNDVFCGTQLSYACQMDQGELTSDYKDSDMKLIIPVTNVLSPLANFCAPCYRENVIFWPFHMLNIK